MFWMSICHVVEHLISEPADSVNFVRDKCARIYGDSQGKLTSKYFLGNACIIQSSLHSYTIVDIVLISSTY